MKTQVFCVKSELRHIQLQLLVNYFVLFLLIFFFLKSLAHEKQLNSNFPNMKLTTYSRLTQDQARKNELHLRSYNNDVTEVQ